MKDSGKREEFDTGAVRDDTTNKGMPNLIKFEMIDRLSKWLELGANKYSPRNWEKGMPISRCFDSLFRHAYKANEGWTDEDHLAAVVCNAMFIMWYEENKPELDDRAKKEDL
jgi:hypothetical protein